MYGERLKLIGFKGVCLYREESLDRGGESDICISSWLKLEKEKVGYPSTTAP